MRSLVVAALLIVPTAFPTLAQDEPVGVRADSRIVRPGAMAVRTLQADMVLEIDGIPQQIEVQSWSWGVTQTGAARAGAGRGAGRAQFQPLTVTKRVDATSPQLFVDTASGRHLPRVALTVRLAGGASSEYVRYTLEDVLISSITVDTSTGAPTESLSFNYGKIEIEYGAPGQAGPVKAGWDVMRNTRI